jgi:UDP:flavonoid glycosyltransferase YjiC (YdhE family)
MNGNRTEQEQQDILKTIFDRMADEPLSPAFLPEMMQRIREESVRIRKRDARRWRAALAAASLTIVGLAVAAFAYPDIPQFRVGFPRISIPPFYIYIGLLMLVLLFVDSWFRQKYFEKHPENF